MADLDAESVRRLVHRRCDQLLAAPGGAGRLGIGRGDLVSGLVQRPQSRDGKRRRAHEDNPHTFG
jgi:hypothetical protein